MLHLVEAPLCWEIPHLMEIPRMEKSIFTKEFSKLHTKYGMMPRVDMHVKK